ncbi:MAG TPA: ATP-binding cassette domain-containing protein [Candidatus Fimimonas merdipullorum]|uniref:ATP-binding cassette domain-containing protein n=1 Tax=Candidatus Fimimonas merdipullorum TaxID=2840822 RepID=A0A9D1MWK3_9BACT|nr:ATP-binding cassette domain-containing protein [Candidatus Fimimonas merdipullorum]
MSNEKKKLLSVTNLKKYFPIAKTSIFQREQLYVKANEDISFDIYEGETIGVVGESGCGKSTLGRVILQLYDQTAGTTMYYGKSRSEVAPRYVWHTLNNVGKYTEKYHKALRKAEVAAAECDAAGENATFFQHQRKNLADAAAQTALTNVASIVGGFMGVEDNHEGIALLKKRHAVHVEIAVIKSKIADADNKTVLLEEKLAKCEKDNQREALGKKLEALAQKKQKLQQELEAKNALRAEIRESLIREKQRFADNEDFRKYEKLLDSGIDLSRLRYGEMRHLRRDLQIIFQDPYSSLNPRMTVGQIIEEGLTTHKMFTHGTEAMKQYILKVMDECGLQDYMLHRYPHQFSGGQRQRICIARALAVKPKFVVCDECVSALDVSIQSQIINLLQELKEKENLTYLFISHDLSVVRFISDKIVVMYLGNIVEYASAEELFDDPRHPYTLALLSSIPTTDEDSLKKERILLEGNIPSPIRPPDGCKFHTRCYMACEECKRVPPPLVEIKPGHFVACHRPEKKMENGEYLFEVATEKRSERETRQTAQSDEVNKEHA